jgi:hypothetical protein
MRVKWNVRKSASTRPVGASSSPSANSWFWLQKAAFSGGFLFSSRRNFRMIKVGIVGGTGYTGVELLRLLAQHPDVN